MPNHLPAFLIKKIYNYVDELYLQQHMNYFHNKIKNLLEYTAWRYWTIIARDTDEYDYIVDEEFTDFYDEMIDIGYEKYTPITP